MLEKFNIYLYGLNELLSMQVMNQVDFRLIRN